MNKEHVIKICSTHIGLFKYLICDYYWTMLVAHPYGRKWRRTKEPLDESEREKWKVGLKLSIQKTKTMASGPITSWLIDGETMETVTDFIFLGSKITAVGDCSHEIKRHLLLGRKAMINLDSVLKSRDITLPTKVRLVKAMVFPVVIYGCESWNIKKAECWRIDAFELWCWRRLLRVPWTARKSNQSILKEVSSEYSLEGLMLQLKLPIFWPPGVKNWLIGKASDAGKYWRWEKGMTEDKMVEWHHQLNEQEFEQAPEVGDGQGSLTCCSPWGHKESDMTERLNWCWWPSGKESSCQTGDMSSISGLGKSRGEENDNPHSSIPAWKITWTEKPGRLQSMGLQRVGHAWVNSKNNTMFCKLTRKWKLLSVPSSLWPYGVYSPWDSPHQNTGVGSLSLLQGIFPNRESNPGLPQCRQILHPLRHEGSPNLGKY